MYARFLVKLARRKNPSKIHLVFLFKTREGVNLGQWVAKMESSLPRHVEVKMKGLASPGRGRVAKMENTVVRFWRSLENLGYKLVNLEHSMANPVVKMGSTMVRLGGEEG